MANILFLNYDKTNACSFYRSAGVVRNLRKLCDHEIVVAQWNEIILHWATLSDFDIVMIQRPYGKPALDLCDYIKGMKIALWVDYDDNLLCVPNENRAHWIYDPPDVKESIEKIIALADIVTVTTEDLKTAFSTFNKNIEVIPNAFDSDLFKRGFLKPRSNLVVWRGTDSHIWDLMSYGKAIAKATAEFPDNQFLYIGFSPWFMPTTENQSILAEMDLMKYFRFTYNTLPMCVHVPLVDELFNRCKSNIACIEGSYFGAVCITPAWWDIPGTLPYTDAQSYYEALRKVLAGEIDVEAQNKIAWEYISDNLALNKVNIKRLNIINSFQ